MAEEDHRHCKICGKVVGPEAEYCSKACRRKREEAQRGRQNLTYLMYAAIMVLAIILVVQLVHG
jgi:predicted nucleic acid-binding Zn ribbon protein